MQRQEHFDITKQVRSMIKHLVLIINLAFFAIFNTYLDTLSSHYTTKTINVFKFATNISCLSKILIIVRRIFCFNCTLQSLLYHLKGLKGASVLWQLILLHKLHKNFIFYLFDHECTH